MKLTKNEINALTVLLEKGWKTETLLLVISYFEFSLLIFSVCYVFMLNIFFWLYMCLYPLTLGLLLFCGLAMMSAHSQEVLTKPKHCCLGKLLSNCGLKEKSTINQSHIRFPKGINVIIDSTGSPALV